MATKEPLKAKATLLTGLAVQKPCTSILIRRDNTTVVVRTLRGEDQAQLAGVKPLQQVSVPHANGVRKTRAE